MGFITMTTGLMQAVSQKHNAQFGVQQANQARMALAGNPAMEVAQLGDAAYAPGVNGSPSPMQALYLRDRALTLNTIQQQIQALVAEQIEANYRKQLPEEIKSTFSTFNAQG